MKHHKKKNSQVVQISLLIVTGLVLGFLVMNQSRYFTSYVDIEGRDSSENIFREILFLKTSTDELKEEITDLEEQLADLSDRAMALGSIEKEIQKNKIIAGDIAIFGPGIMLEIDNEISDIWFTDIVNELLGSGAEAISVNDIRLTNSTIGFDTLPGGQIMLNSVILSPPFTFKAIGDKATLKQALEAPRGILDRMGTSFEELTYSLEEKDRVETGKV